MSSSKKTGRKKFVPLFEDGTRNENVVMLPGRNVCDCQASKHKLISNCMKCGRIVCEQEGAGPCMFCGELVCSDEQFEVLLIGSKKSEQLRHKLSLVEGGKALQNADDPKGGSSSAFQKAFEFKDRLLEYDKKFRQNQTKVIDDERDYFTVNSKWLSPAERKRREEIDKQLYEERHAPRSSKKFTIDFAGREIKEEPRNYHEKMDENFDLQYFEDESSDSDANVVDDDDDRGLFDKRNKDLRPVYVPQVDLK